MLLLLPIINLMLDAARVIEIRVGMMALGTGTPEEMLLMFSEKSKAMGEASAILVAGGNTLQVIEHYQQIVTANVARLSER